MVASSTPWYELPSIGGEDSLRGYWEGRFRGEGSIGGNIELRNKLFQFMLDAFFIHKLIIFDSVLFFDTGRIIEENNDYITHVKHWKYSYGIGLRFFTSPGLMGRMDIGFGPEEPFAAYINFGTVF